MTTTTTDSPAKYFVHSGEHWLIRTSQGGFAWVHQNQIEDHQPDKFTEPEFEHVKNQLGHDTPLEKTEKPPAKPVAQPPSATKEEAKPIKGKRFRFWGGKRGEGSQKPKNSQPEDHSDWLQHVPPLFLWLLLGLLLLGIGVAIAINTDPFIKMTQLIMGNMGINGSQIPVINWILAALGIGLIYLVAITWYAISQALELAPTLMTASDKRTLRMINSILNYTGLEIKAGDSAELRWLKTKYNNRPVASLQFFRAARLVIYTKELIICWITHPPIQGSVVDFIVALVTGQFSKINWGNVFLTLSVLFLVEVLVQIALHTLKHIHADRQLAKAEREGASK